MEQHSSEVSTGPTSKPESSPLPANETKESGVSASEDERLTIDKVLNSFGNCNRYFILMLLVLSSPWGFFATHILIGNFEGNIAPCSNDTSLQTHCAEHSHVYNKLRDDYFNYCTYMFLAGNFASALILSPLADWIGRLPVIAGSMAAMGVLGIGVAFSIQPGYLWLFATLRFLQGCMYAGGTIFNWILVMEVVPTKVRGFVSQTMGLLWVVGYVALSPLAYAFCDAQYFFLTISLVTIAAALPVYLIPDESIHFYLVKGKSEKVAKWLQRAEKWGGRPCAYPLDRVLSQCELPKEKRASFWASAKAVFRDCYFCVLIFMCLYVWFINTMIYYFLTVTISMVPGNVYIIHAVVGLCEIPSYILSPIFLNKFGRRPTVMLSQIAAGLVMICLCAIPKSGENCGKPSYAEDLKYVFCAVWALSKGFLMIAYVSLFTYTSELLPSEIRGTFMGLASVIARLGPIVGIGVGYSSALYDMLPVVICGVLAITSGVCIYFFPETLGRDLPVTVADALALRRPAKKEPTSSEVVEDPLDKPVIPFDAGTEAMAA
ncbi:sugar transporter [Aphelenchoides avenae]|nr:sugar transporter [Aphelenchus avenae]